MTFAACSIERRARERRGVFLFRALCVLLGAAAAAVGQTQASAPRIENLAWLAGCWSLTKSGSHVEEHWLAPAGGAMLGISRTIRDGRLTEFEFMSIREVNGRLSFVAVPSGQKEAVFPFARGSATELVFEELKHDFPQRVIYRNVDGVLAARIEGVVNGKARGVDFSYRRCETH